MSNCAVTSTVNADSEMEEGEIVDDLDDLSEISSEEEFLLRQRLQVLENYNNVLERKKVKSSPNVPGEKHKDDMCFQDLSEISATELEDSQTTISLDIKDEKNVKISHKQKKRKQNNIIKNIGKHKEHKKKTHKHKKKLQVKLISESSEESDDEYRNKRRKLANAVKVHNDKNDSSLKARLTKMLRGKQSHEAVAVLQSELETNLTTNNVTPSISSMTDVTVKPVDELDLNVPKEKNKILPTVPECLPKEPELIDLCTDDEVCFIPTSKELQNVDSTVIKKQSEDDSDENLELLRQNVLKTKLTKLPTKTAPKEQNVFPITLNKKNESEDKTLNISEDEDSDTAELRMICLKSALLKKAIEMKKKQKMKKRLSVSSNTKDDGKTNSDEFNIKSDLENNNTDIESVDMDIGSDADEKAREVCATMSHKKYSENNVKTNECDRQIPNTTFVEKENELDEDEDLLRAKLLTSLSKNLPHLVDPGIIESNGQVENLEKDIAKLNQPKKNVTEEKRFIINLGESDSEGEHEATENLTKMHMKLSEQLDFQQKLDVFLRSTRMEVENKKLPDVVQQRTAIPVVKPTKFVPKALHNLPKSEQIEYKNLVRRMNELEKMKKARQFSMNATNLGTNNISVKETLKPRNVAVDRANVLNRLGEQIDISRKRISEESAAILRLKDEALKLSQKYKIVATELRNISTAITLNKKQQRAAQNRLSKIRLQHQLLSKRSAVLTNTKSENYNISTLTRLSNKVVPKVISQKENNPARDDYKNPHILKSVKVSLHNDFKDETNQPNSRLSVQVDLVNNKKIIKLPSPRNITVDTNEDSNRQVIVSSEGNNLLEFQKDRGSELVNKEMMSMEPFDSKNNCVDDYKSPLESLETETWQEDPNAVLCPFQFSGNCKDPDCIFLHPKMYS